MVRFISNKKYFLSNQLQLLYVFDFFFVSCYEIWDRECQRWAFILIKIQLLPIESWILVFAVIFVKLLLISDDFYLCSCDGYQKKKKEDSDNNFFDRKLSP